MTRFARAKGSKASNEKTPEDSTPWEVMKEQLLQAKKESEEAKGREEAERQRIENYENFLKEHKTQKRKSTWCDFPESEGGGTKKHVQEGEQTVIKKKKNKQLLEPNNTCLSSPNKVNNHINPEIKLKTKKNKQNIVSVTKKGENNVGDHKNNPQETEFGKNKPKKIKRKKLKEALVEEESKPLEDMNVISVSEELPSKKKNKKKNLNSNLNSTQHSDNSELTMEIQTVAGNSTKNGSRKKNKKGKEPRNATDVQNNYTSLNNNSDQVDKDKFVANKQNKIKAPKTKKFKDGIPTRRKEVNDTSFQLIINGKEVELVRFDGFPIMKKDAERIQELKNSMIKKGIPKSEVQRTIKLERRRAEKALARLKRDVCYNCRKGGHNLSDCPDLKSKIPGVDAAEGVCFKCGSTEHRQFECKVQRDKEFRFATCFICKEPGHIARQCPDNPKGLYPNGGACKLCGDVTHLRKDCPTINDQKEETTVKLQILATSDNIEEMSAPMKSSGPTELSKKPKKIKF